jgi:8-oxo-dGTP pyrophosphatase MutT (NUDIX family)
VTGKKPVKPKDAASLIVVDRSGKTPRLLMGRRHAAHRFMPNVFVFPGGRVDAADYRQRLDGTLPPHLREALLSNAPKSPPKRPEALIIAALREAEEEAGLSFVTQREPLVFAAQSIRFVARAITPPNLPRRYDTRFFMLDRTAVQSEIPNRSGPEMELTELLWVEHAEALNLEIHEITRAVLMAIATAIDDPRDLTEIPFYRVVRGGRLKSFLPT